MTEPGAMAAPASRPEPPCRWEIWTDPDGAICVRDPRDGKVTRTATMELALDVVAPKAAIRR